MTVYLIKMLQVPITDAKAHFSQLMTKAQDGETIIITRHGQEIGRIVPPSKPQSAESLVEQFRKFREGIQPVPLEDIISSIHEGHKY